MRVVNSKNRLIACRRPMPVKKCYIKPHSNNKPNKHFQEIQKINLKYSQFFFIVLEQLDDSKSDMVNCFDVFTQLALDAEYM